MTRQRKLWTKLTKWRVILPKVFHRSSNMATQEELQDVLMLARTVNNDVQYVRKSMLSDNKGLPQMVKPENAIRPLLQNGQPPPPVNIQPIPSQTVVGPMGEELGVSAARPLIPLPEGYSTPVAQPPPQAPNQSVPTAPPILQPTPIQSPSTNPNQLEFPLSYEKRTEFQNLRDHFDDKLKVIDAKLEMLNAKLNELLSRKRGAYGPRTPKS